MKLSKKIHSQKGETLVEALASILVLTMSMVILATGLSCAGKITTLIKLEETSFNRAGAEPREAVVKLEDYPIGRDGHMTESGYYYYD